MRPQLWTFILERKLKNKSWASSRAVGWSTHAIVRFLALRNCALLTAWLLRPSQSPGNPTPRSAEIEGQKEATHCEVLQ